MSALKALSKLAAGARPDGEVLPACRLGAFGIEVTGEEAIVQSFRRSPLQLASSAEVIEAPGHIAVFDNGYALFADLYGENIARIWRLGAGTPALSEPAIGVPFDPDLWQARRDVALRHADHRALSDDGFAAVEQIGRDIARRWDPDSGASDYRTRPFLLRAFSAGTRGAALFAVFRLGPQDERSVGFSMVAARFDVAHGKLAGYTLFRDLAGEAANEQAPWLPRVAT